MSISKEASSSPSGFFRNDGKGNLTMENEALPPIIGNFACIEASDFDGDGFVDLFFGARAVPGNYGLPPRSFLLANEGGKWRDASLESLAGIGMVTDATWTDIDNDQDEDLVVVGDWMEIHIFRNDHGNLNLYTRVNNTHGWWRSVEAADLDHDGDQDLVVGNWGLNSKFTASPTRPLTMFVNDFDLNGKSEFIINWFSPLDDKPYPFATKMDLMSQLPHLRKQNLKYEEYAKQNYESLFPAEVRSNAISYTANNLQSGILWNDEGQFNFEALPKEAQVSPVYGIALNDFNRDGHLDIWLGGNFYGLKPQVGRQDASRGVYYSGLGGRNFKHIPNIESGIFVKGEVRDAKVLDVNGEQMLLIARNNESLLAYRFNQDEM